MLFLCLHGRGTNSKILEMQTAAIRYELGDHHTYDFVEGTVPWIIDPLIKDLLPNELNTLTYFDYTSAESITKAVKDLHSLVHTDGPYDGVIAFSQAASLVGTWMIHQTRENNGMRPFFKCAIFLSAALLPYDYDALQEGRLLHLTHQDTDEAMEIPTAHIWGKNDPFAETAIEFSKLYNGNLRSLFVHPGVHEIPGSGSKEAVAGSVNAIQRAVQLAQESCLR